MLQVEIHSGLTWCDRAIGLFEELVEAWPVAFSEHLAAVKALRAELASLAKEHD